MLAFRPVGYIVGWLVLALGFVMFLPLAVDVALGDGNAPGFAAGDLKAGIDRAEGHLHVAEVLHADQQVPAAIAADLEFLDARRGRADAFDRAAAAGGQQDGGERAENEIAQ